MNETSNPYDAPQQQSAPLLSPGSGPSRGFWIALGAIVVGLGIVLAIPYVQKLKQDQLRREALENIRKLGEAIKEHEQRAAAK